MDYRQNIKNSNNLINLDECKKNISNMKEFIGKGGQGTIYKLQSKTCGMAVLKTYHKKTNETEIYKEINILDRVKNLIDKDICPHFLYYYDFFKKDNIFNIIMEYADGDLEKWVKTTHQDDEWKSIIFQFIVGVHTIQKYLKGFHSDLKPKNIFYIETAKDGYYEYLINNKKYYLKNMGTLLILADYGHFQSILFDKNDLSEEDIQNAIRENQDFDYLRDFSDRINVTNLQKKYQLNDLVNKFRDNDKFNTYMKQESDKIKKNMKNYPQYVIDKFLTRSLLYFCLEEKLLNPELNGDLIPPSDNITNFIKKVLNEKSNIEDILNKHFSEYQENKNYRIIKTFNLNSLNF
jgi:hypothetical protein